MRSRVPARILLLFMILMCAIYYVEIPGAQTMCRTRIFLPVGGRRMINYNYFFFRFCYLGTSSVILKYYNPMKLMKYIQ